MDSTLENIIRAKTSVCNMIHYLLGMKSIWPALHGA